MNGRPWTKAEERELRRRYSREPAAWIARDLGRGVSAIYGRADLLGLKKDPGFASACTRQRWAEGRHDNSRRSHFKPGVPSWSKGTKGRVGVQEGCRATQFKKGELNGVAQAKYVPIGSLRVTRDGQLQQKVSDDPTIYPAKRWVAVTRLVWEAANGPVPPGHAVAFKPGRQTVDPERITLDAVELLSRRELMLRNSRHTRYPPELNALIQLKGALNRKLNRRQREECNG